MLGKHIFSAFNSELYPVRYPAGRSILQLAANSWFGDSDPIVFDSGWILIDFGWILIDFGLILVDLINFGLIFIDLGLILIGFDRFGVIPDSDSISANGGFRKNCGLYAVPIQWCPADDGVIRPRVEHAPRRFFEILRLMAHQGAPQWVWRHSGLITYQYMYGYFGVIWAKK